MTDRPGERTGHIVVLALPATIDLSNAPRVSQDILASFAGGVRTVIADMNPTIRCSVAGVHYLGLTCQRAADGHGELRLVIPPGSEALRVFALTGQDRWMPVYSSVAAALAGTAGQPQAGLGDAHAADR